ncbi:MAG: ABC transporter permease [Acidobacteria bacterium]|nr:ABC transporter permease [Acidobacteriota bacterium]
MWNLLRDVRYGLAMMLKRPGFTLVTLATLVLGIGANTAIFSVVNSLLLRPLPYEGAERVVRLHDSKPPQFEQFPVSPGNFMAWREQAGSFEQIAAYFTGPPLVMHSGERPEQLDGVRVSASLFPMLRVKPVIGRPFTPEEEESGRDQVVLLSHGLWQRRFGGAPSVIGQALTLSDKTYTVVGVMPPDFKFPTDRTEAWVPTGFTQKDRTRYGSHYLSVLARLKPGAQLPQAQSEMDAIAGRLAEQNPQTNSGWGTKVVAWQEDVVGSLRTPLLILSGAVVFVLLIACVNVTNLLLAHATSRSREVAIRMALGASRGRIVRQFLTESVLLSVVGGALGLLLAVWGVGALASLASDTLPGAKDFWVDGRVLAFTAAVSLLTGIVFGLTPALQFSRPDLNETLKEGGRSGSDGGFRNRPRRLLVITEVVMALVLLVGAGLLIRSFQKLRDVSPGFDTQDVLTMNVALPRTRYKEEAKQADFFEKALREVSTLPGVKAAAAVSPLPFGNDMNYGFSIIGRPEFDPNQLPTANYYLISPDYFRVMGVTLLKGRAFTDNDRQNVPRVAIINETMARKYFPDQDPLGKQIEVSNGSDVTREIVGVVGDVKQYGLDTEVKPQIYEPYLQEPFFVMTILARTATNPAGMAESIHTRILAVDKDQPVTNVRTMESIVSDSMTKRRFLMTLLSIFAGVALVLATVGIYGVMSYIVSQRTHEIGIRIALGARAADIVKLVVGQAVLLVVVGVVIGLAASFALTRIMSSLLFGVTPTDPPTFAGVSLILIAAALVASYIPARRAMKVDPMEALRQD